MNEHVAKFVWQIEKLKNMHVVVQQMKRMKVFKKLATCLEFVRGK